MITKAKRLVWAMLTTLMLLGAAFPAAVSAQSTLTVDNSCSTGCTPPPVLKTATASVVISPATCTTGQKLNYSNVQYATASGTADGTVGPANYDVIFIADSGAQFDATGNRFLEFKGTLTGPLTDASCSGGQGSTTQTPSSPAVSAGGAGSFKALPYTAGDTDTAIIATGGVLAALIGAVGLRRLLTRSL